MPPLTTIHTFPSRIFTAIACMRLELQSGRGQRSMAPFADHLPGMSI